MTMDSKLFTPTKKSAFCSISIFSMLLIFFIILTTYFSDIFGDQAFIFTIASVGFINGLIFGDTFKKSLFQLIVLIETFLTIYFSIVFAFNPWNNATHIPPSLSNALPLFMAISVFSILGLIFISLVSFDLLLTGLAGSAIKDSTKTHLPHSKIPML